MDNLSVLEQIITATKPLEIGSKTFSPSEMEKEQVKPETTPPVRVEPKETNTIEKKVEKKEIQSEENFKEFFFDTSSPIELSPVWGSTRAALGLAVKEADKNEVSNIAKYAATLIQSDDPGRIFQFISKRLTSMPPNVGNPIYYLEKVLTFELQKKMKERG